MIGSFADRETERLWQGIQSRRLPGDIQRAAFRKLQLIAAAARIEDLKVPPGNRLEALKGSRQGQWSIRINDQWRICFRWNKEQADDVEICDYR